MSLDWVTQNTEELIACYGSCGCGSFSVGSIGLDAKEEVLTLGATYTASKAEEDCGTIIEYLRGNGLWRIPGAVKPQERSFRVSPRPFQLAPELLDFLQRLGPALLKLYGAANKIYLHGQYPWVREYLDIGKPEPLIDHAHMNYHKNRMPAIIRPDIILGPDGNFITELDSVPGGFGLTAGLSRAYSALGYNVLGGADGVVEAFFSALQSTGELQEPTVAIVVSQESESYRPEMDWMASALREAGQRVYSVRPEEVTFAEEGLFLDITGELLRIDVLYRFFELFDLKNIPKSELVAYAARKRRVAVTPPYKHYLEEKILLALFHHPMLETFWRRELGEEHFMLLKSAIPQTWILDPRPVPPHAVIPGFRFREEPIDDWRMLRDATQKERRLVIKPSGFSPLAWGSHGVVVGHDVSGEQWANAIDSALGSFHSSPYILQHFHEGARFQIEYYEEEAGEIRQMEGRVRLSPYYFHVDQTVQFSGALATICPLDKKLIHGMVDAVMVPSAPSPEVAGNA